MRAPGHAVWLALALVAVTGCEAVVGIETLQMVREADAGEEASEVEESARDAGREDARESDASSRGGPDADRD